MKPRCYECLSENVAVRVVDQCGFEQWFCAEDWEANQRFYAALTKKLEDAVATLTSCA